MVNPASASPIAWQRKGSAANGMAVYEALAGGPQFTRLAIARVGGTTQFAWELGRFATLAPGQWSAWTSADFTSDDPGFVWGVLNTEPYQPGEASPRHGPKLRVQVGRPEIGVPAATPDEALPGC